jgi:hypothetical protein
MRIARALAALMSSCASAGVAHGQAITDPAAFCRSSDEYELREAIFNYRRCPSIIVTRQLPTLNRYDPAMAAAAVLSACDREAEAVKTLLRSCSLRNEAEAERRFGMIYRPLFQGTETMIVLERASQQP